jgi:hypothetical protein
MRAHNRRNAEISVEMGKAQFILRLSISRPRGAFHQAAPFGSELIGAQPQFDHGVLVVGVGPIDHRKARLSFDVTERGTNAQSVTRFRIERRLIDAARIVRDSLQRRVVARSKQRGREDESDQRAHV